MISSSQIDPGTVQAYLETDDCVCGDYPATNGVGDPCPALASLHAVHGVDCSAFITACNPFSHCLDDAAKVQRQAASARELKQRSLTVLEGVGQHPSNQRPDEASFLVISLTLEEAKTRGLALKRTRSSGRVPTRFPSGSY